MQPSITPTVYKKHLIYKLSKTEFEICTEYNEHLKFKKTEKAAKKFVDKL